MAAMQQAIARVGADTRAAPSLQCSKQTRRGPSTAPADPARLGSCAGSLASASLTARPGSAELRAASAHACTSVNISLQAKTDTLRVSVADQCQPGETTPSIAMRCRKLW